MFVFLQPAVQFSLLGYKNKESNKKRAAYSSFYGENNPRRNRKQELVIVCVNGERERAYSGVTHQNLGSCAKLSHCKHVRNKLTLNKTPTDLRMTFDE